MLRSEHCRIKPILIVIVLLFWAVACASDGATGGGRHGIPAANLTILAAASLTEVMDEIALGFTEKTPGVSLDLILAGSQELRTQLAHGARGDVFLSADPTQMDLAVEQGLVRQVPVVFTTNSLAVIFANRDGPSISALDDLAFPNVTLALALPEVPAGAYAREAIRGLGAMLGSNSADYAGKVMANVVTLETNVRGVAMKVALGEVDAGIVYMTDARAGFVAENTYQIPIPPEANQQARYLVASLKDSSNHDLSDRFVGFLLSDPGQTILRSYGFGPLPANKQDKPKEASSILRKTPVVNAASTSD